MALTAAEKAALKAIISAETDRTGPPPVEIFDPAADSATRAFVKTYVQAARDRLAAQKAGLPALNTQLTNQIAVLDGLLAKFP